MQRKGAKVAVFGLISFLLSSCSFNSLLYEPSESLPRQKSIYSSRLPEQIPSEGERVILVSPRAHAWGAYDANGNLVRSGLASAGSRWCHDIGSPCQTEIGTYRIYYMGDADCVSARFPIPKGGAPMPYCMYFNKNQALHGSPNVVEGNISHGCVRMHTGAARWLRYEFADIGTKVIIAPY